MSRLTLNLGGRYDYFNAEVPAQSSAAGPWIQARDFPAIENVPNWHDWSVRLAGTYDLFGTGKTAIKANASKYIASAAAGYAQNFNPMSYCGSCAGATRAWLDFDGNRSILDSNGNIQFNEVIGGTSNFGQITNRPDPDLHRGYNWEYNASVQHELMPRVSVTGGFYRRQFYNLDVTDNLNLGVDEWNPLTIVTPTDPRLPTSGDPINMFSLNANKVGVATDNLRTFSAINRTVYNGFEVSANARFSKALVFGGVTTERRATESCDERDNPNGLRFCDAIPPFRTTVKLSGVYQLPWDFNVSGTFLAAPGASINANYTVTAATRRPGDHRIDRGRDHDQREPHRAQHGVPRLPQQFRHALREESAVRRTPHPALRRHLQRAERRHGGPRQRDLRLQPRDQHVEQPADDHGRPLLPVRYADVVLAVKKPHRFWGSGVLGFAGWVLWFWVGSAGPRPRTLDLPNQP